jgi:hypothetical protein
VIEQFGTVDRVGGFDLRTPVSIFSIGTKMLPALNAEFFPVFGAETRRRLRIFPSLSL